MLPEGLSHHPLLQMDVMWAMHTLHLYAGELAAVMEAAAEAAQPTAANLHEARELAATMWKRFGLVNMRFDGRDDEQFVRLICQLDMQTLALQIAEKLKVWHCVSHCSYCYTCRTVCQSCLQHKSYHATLLAGMDTQRLIPAVALMTSVCNQTKGAGL